MRLGLPKGSVLPYSKHILQRFAGESYREGQLSRSDSDGNLIMLLKHRDIPKLVDSGDLDFGITGSEWLAELNSAAHIIGELDWCDARISLIGVPGASVKNIGQAPSVCATEFPNITRRYLGEAGVPHVKVKAVSGSCEAFIPTVCGFGVDCVESGETLRANQLVEIEPILTSRVVLISRVPLSHLDQGKIEQLKELTGDIRWLD